MTDVNKDETILTPPNAGGANGDGAPNAKPNGTGVDAGKVDDPNGGKKDATDPGAGGDKKDQPPADAKPGAPEKYGDFTLPEGTALDTEILTEFQASAKEMNLTQEQAQKLVDIQLKAVAKAYDATDTNFKQLKETWKTESMKLLGNEPEKQLAVAAKAMSTFGTPKLREVLEESGLGNHPELVSFFLKVGKAVSEDTLPDGKDAKATKSAAEVLYPAKG